MLRSQAPIPSNRCLDEMSGRAAADELSLSATGGARSENSSPFVNDFCGFGSALGGPASSWKEEECGGSPAASPSARLEPERPRYLWEHIPPRLAPAEGEDDLLGFPTDDCDFDAGVDFDPVPATTTSNWWESSSLRQPEDQRQNPVNHVSVSINTGYGADVERRPLHSLHHSGGGLATSNASRQIDIGLNTSDAPSRIQLEISGCPANVTVSVTTKCEATPASHTRPALSRGCVDHTRASARSRGLEPTPCSSHQPAAQPESSHIEDEQKVLARALRHLRESGWYYGSLSSQQAQLCLQGTPEGTYLARDSLHERFAFALSVQTVHGPTSVRIQLAKGRFRLDAPAELTMPTFGDVNQLVEHYAKKGPFAVDGLPSLTMRLKKPLLKQAPSLQHLCRLTLNRATSDPQSGVERRIRAVLPPVLQHYLSQYPYPR